MESERRAQIFSALDKRVAEGALPKESVDRLREIAAQGDKQMFDRRAETLQSVAERHAARTDAEHEKIKDEWKQRWVVRGYGERMLKVMDGISDVDTNPLKQALRGGNISKIREEAIKLRDVGKQITALNKLDNPLMVARQTSMATAKEINENVTRTLGKMPADPILRKAKLEYEIDWMRREGKRRYPSTYKYAVDAYKKELGFTQRKIDLESVRGSVEEALRFALTSRSKAIKTLADEMRLMLGSAKADISAIKAKANELNNKYNQLRPKPKGVLSPQPIPKESLQQMKTRLGVNMPPTLENLEKLIDSRLSAGTYSSWTANEIAEAERIIKEVLDNGCYGMNVPRVDSSGNDDVIDKIFKSWFKNQIEMGTGNGMVNVAARKKASTSLFGTPAKTAAVDYERYGFLMDRNVIAQSQSGIAGQYWNYGDGIQVRFKKDKVIATFTMEDSLGSGMHPSLCSDPKITSFEPYGGGRAGKAIITTTADTRSAVDATRKFAISYIELQYHNQLTLDCVESVFIPKDVIPKLKAGTISLIRKSGATIYSEGASGELIVI